MPIDNRPIGIFDSGIGGLTVLRQIKKLLPNEDIIYVADNKNSPFGDKSVDEILNINDRIISFLLDKNVKLIVIACNTSSSLALEYDQDKFNIEFVDMLIDGLWFTKDLKANSKVGVMATMATVRSNSYPRIISSYNKNLQLKQIASPKLVPIIEECLFDLTLDQQNVDNKNKVRNIVSDYIQTFTDYDYLILGCSHYPYITNYIKQINPKINIVDPSYFVALKAKETIDRIGSNENTQKNNTIFYYTKENSILLKNAEIFGFTSLMLTIL
ncbi:MAG: glutamate racemase [Candidatus Margulisbacteria bacterium GWF2_35_9]|nr:MAG: glutamate racemase [Candidatus Margulisbacteria bacterium GWF2_35_9]